MLITLCVKFLQTDRHFSPPIKKKCVFSVCSRNITEMMTTVSLQIVGIIEPIIQHADWFFPGGEEGKRRGNSPALFVLEVLKWHFRKENTELFLFSSVFVRDRVQCHRKLRQPRPHQPQRQLQLDAVSRYGSDGSQAERPEPAAAQRRHRQHDAGVL